ncbi:formin-like protein 18-like isoform X1 [Hibiscus syriacus]|uniref:Formin-like protein 18-like isoform X1 n=1 Tax=Hibiscus syriacus TaxID=106335 RepID=A0A6A3A986_HIBSY|nr:formin-like protein 18-like isoform X1 [Hibiscus syriacus]
MDINGENMVKGHRDNPPPGLLQVLLCPKLSGEEKVQRSAESSILVATYEGEHNHTHHSPSALSSLSPVNSGAATANNSRSARVSSSSSAPAVTVDLTKPAGSDDDTKKPTQKVDQPAIQQILVQQIAASLTRDPNFTAALAAAISGKVVDQKL